MATTQVIDLLLQDGSDYESTVGILGLCYATVAAHAGAAYKRTPPQKTRARRLTGSLCAASTIRSLGFAAFAILTHAPGTRSRLFAKGVVVLLCVPDFIVVSSYALLIVVWFEAFLDARRHWLDRGNYRWHWRAAYFGLNAGLVGAMVALYTLIFFGGLAGSCRAGRERPGVELPGVFECGLGRRWERFSVLRLHGRRVF